ncbi:helix-turn-helix transcriptional regulator [Vibrio nigripulchritudo]|uniref:helix-turn-helix transcriptional regulator n=1 Tax=Vibrio nigripulchritudo TaxID=28173 RepID=UPI00190D0BCE|nr:LuxR family transcriptional regulator [Vibrio nigripulchritudo]
MNYADFEILLRRKMLSAISEKLNFFGIHYFSYVIYSKKEMSSHAMISNFPNDWLVKYKKNKLYKEDPIIKHARKSIAPFSWFDENSTKFEDIKNVEVDASKKRDMVTGYTFTLHDHLNNFAALSVCDIENEAEFHNLVNACEDKLQMVLIDTHQQVVALLSQQAQRDLNPIHITEREKEVLHWACMGKTYSEISIILGIKHVTVKYHVSNLCKKINASNFKQAIRRYTELNLI